MNLNPTYLAVGHERYEPILDQLVLVQDDINHDHVAIPPGLT